MFYITKLKKQTIRRVIDVKITSLTFLTIIEIREELMNIQVTMKKISIKNNCHKNKSFCPYKKNSRLKLWAYVKKEWAVVGGYQDNYSK